MMSCRTVRKIDSAVKCVGKIILFNDAFNTFYLRLYGVGHMVNDHSDSDRKPTAATWATLID